MRLINVHDLSVRTFKAASIAKYVVTSHRWVEDEEASTQQLRDGLDLSKSGHRKIQGFADYIRKEIPSMEWFWVDTCCIDQTSSQEVSTAINSMFRWYNNAEICLAYLSDVSDAADMKQLSQSIWFKRGWTLQELLAPHLVVFLSRDWDVIGHKGGDIYSKTGAELRTGPSLCARIAAFTQLPQRVLTDYKHSDAFSSRTKMHWAAGRETTVDEDSVYCLLGIMGVTIPIIYGEGRERAKERLLREIDIGQENVVAGPSASSIRCVSIPHSTVATYTNRVRLSNELESVMQKPFGSPALAHACTVCGLGGTGKTQLILHHIDLHQTEYNAIFWLDFKNEETARLSFRRCCRALSASVGSAAGFGLAEDESEVQGLLQWLRAQGREYRWLVVVDNADDFSWNIPALIPQGAAGSVIVVSQDANASRLLGGKSNTVRVDAMSTAEATTLLSKSVGTAFHQSSDGDDEDAHNEREKSQRLDHQLVSILDNLPLAIDLAGAQIRAEIEDGTGLEMAMQRYLDDLDRHRDALLRNAEYASSTSYRQTIWTAWETTLESLKKLELESPDHTKPLELLHLLVMLDRTNIQDELFRLASSGLRQMGGSILKMTPHWLRSILSTRDDGTWDDFYFRAAARPLLRYGLVRSTSADWPGLTMHGLVQWRISREPVQRSRHEMFCVFIALVCLQQWLQPNKQFWRHLWVHLPSITTLTQRKPSSPPDALAWASLVIGLARLDEFDPSNGAEKVSYFVTAAKEYVRSLGKSHRDTLVAMVCLAYAYAEHGWCEKAETLQAKVVTALSELLGDEHPCSLQASSNLAVAHLMRGGLEGAAKLDSAVLDARRRTLGNEHPDTLVAADNLSGTYREQGRLEDAEKLEFEVLEVRSKRFREDGSEDPFSVLVKLGHVYRAHRLWDINDLRNYHASDGMRDLDGDGQISSRDTLLAAAWRQPAQSARDKKDDASNRDDSPSFLDEGEDQRPRRKGTKRRTTSMGGRSPKRRS